MVIQSNLLYGETKGEWSPIRIEIILISDMDVFNIIFDSSK